MSTKCVKMCRNGDGFFPPVNVVVNPRDIRSMDAFLDRVTQATRMRNAARKVCTPKKGHKIEDLTKLISGETYVAVGQEAFKCLKYENIRIHRPVIQHRQVKIEPVKHSRIVISARCRKVALWESSGLKTIYVYRNGDDKNPSHKVLLDRRTLLNMDKVLELVTDRVKLESGAVLALYTMSGKEIYRTLDLISGNKFKKTAYNDNKKISPNNSPRRAKFLYRDGLYEQKRIFVLPSKTENKELAQKPQTRKEDNSEKRSLALPTKTEENEFVSQSQREKEIKSKTENISRKDRTVERSIKKDKHDGIEESVNAAGLHKTQSMSPKNSNADCGDKVKTVESFEGVYKASGARSEKARPVDDDKEVKIEKPLDQITAQQVTEEVIEGDI
ncbi:doublecortin domain-containing protein 2-like isoform X2 [Xenia sp. Carnegie-2017]|uniref:doublecortin domain-containing protein 2-like isoform X2 n=1 Tax=Xenia sp. Carnegie-2017 TaxID=2897299 RepID=UPI001F039D65|nr:doublecortin domain-containing protein 2-like isoform X2 [Xenia sp. Carnegie-2017]